MRLAQEISRYRQAVTFGAGEPEEPDTSSLPANMRARGSFNFNTSGVEKDKARAKLGAIEVEVTTAETRVRASIAQVRSALDLGTQPITGELIQENTHRPIIARLGDVEGAMGAGMPRLRSAIEVTRACLQDAAGGRHTSLPGWGPDETANITVPPYAPEPEPPPWYEMPSRTYDGLHGKMEG